MPIIFVHRTLDDDVLIAGILLSYGSVGLFYLTYLADLLVCWLATCTDYGKVRLTSVTSTLGLVGNAQALASWNCS